MEFALINYEDGSKYKGDVIDEKIR